MGLESCWLPGAGGGISSGSWCWWSGSGGFCCSCRQWGGTTAPGWDVGCGTALGCPRSWRGLRGRGRVQRLLQRGSHPLPPCHRHSSLYEGFCVVPGTPGLCCSWFLWPRMGWMGEGVGNPQGVSVLNEGSEQPVCVCVHSGDGHSTASGSWAECKHSSVHPSACIPCCLPAPRAQPRRRGEAGSCTLHWDTPHVPPRSPARPHTAMGTAPGLQAIAGMHPSLQGRRGSSGFIRSKRPSWRNPWTSRRSWTSWMSL